MHALALIIIFRFMIKLVMTLSICYDSLPKVFYSCIICVISRIIFWNLHHDRNYEHVLLFTYLTPASLSSHLSNIPTLNVSNYLDWHQKLLIILGCLDLIRPFVSLSLIHLLPLVLQIRKIYIKSETILIDYLS